MRIVLATLLSISMLFSMRATAQANDGPYRGKVAIITGSSSGLGAELAKLAAEKQMKLVLVDVKPAASKEFAQAYEKKGGEAIVVEADLAKADQRPRVIEAATKRFNRIDYLFNNAGYSYIATVEQMDLAEAHRLFEVNYWAYADLAQRAIPIMKKQGSGTIVNVASILGHVSAGEGMAHYSASKHALVGFFQGAAGELKSTGIKVFIASPGGMRTNIAKNSTGPMADPRRDRAANWEDPAIPAREIFEKIQGEEVVFYPGYVGKQRQQAR